MGLERRSCEGSFSGLSVVIATIPLVWLTTGSLVTYFDLSFFLTIFILIYFIHMSVLSASMYAHHVCAWCLQESQIP